MEQLYITVKRAFCSLSAVIFKSLFTHTIPIITCLNLIPGHNQAASPTGKDNLVKVQSINTSAFKPSFKAIAFFTGRNDLAHISFLKEANIWFRDVAVKNNFVYDTTSDWNKMNPVMLSNYQLVIFLDTRPEDSGQRVAFEQYMKNGGAWIGFHFSGFALTPSAFPQNWNWYHEEFLGSGEYVSNTWRPTAAILKVEKKTIPVFAGVPDSFKSSPNEWYRWKNDLKLNPDIDILVTIDPASFPLGTGPKKHEIWLEGYYPVVWSNKKYAMIYFNMGHNDIEYENRTNKELSYTFANPVQNQLILNSVLYLGKKIRSTKKAAGQITSSFHVYSDETTSY